MLDIAVQLCESDTPEILRYLEYHGQEMDDNLKKQIDICIERINKAAKPKFITKEYNLLVEGEVPGELEFLTGNDIKKHIEGCSKLILFAATLGADVEKAIRIASIKNVSDSVIMDSCASTLMEAVCDTIDSKLRLENGDKFFTFRFSPGYGDLPISVQKKFSILLDTSRKIGINVSDSGIMIPRKSVTAIIGVSDKELKREKLGFKGCNNIKACRFLRRGVRCVR